MTCHELISKNTHLASAPDVASKLAVLLKGSPFQEEVVNLVELDPVLTLKILKVCNTAYFAGREPISSLNEALARLGSAHILRLVWQISLGDRLREALPTYDMEANDLWRHSVSVAIATEELRKRTRNIQEDGSTCFTAGLLHDIGKVIIQQNLSEAGQLKKLCLTKKLTGMEAERELFGMDHAEIGAELLRLWHQADCLIQAVEGHHANLSENQTPLACLVGLADVCAHVQGSAYGWGALALRISSDTLTTLNLTSHHLEETLFHLALRSKEIDLFIE